MPVALCDIEADNYFFVESAKWAMFERGVGGGGGLRMRSNLSNGASIQTN
jgi:hypothetical protein